MGSFEGSSDNVLIAAARRGDNHAFAEIVRRYEGAVAATVIGMMGYGDEADEVGQEVMIKLYRSLDKFKGDAALKTYVTRIAINASLDALRRRKRNLLRFFRAETKDGSSWEDNIPSNADHAKDFENRELVQNALGRLSPEHRSVAVLRLMHGYSTNEVAKILNIAEGTVLSRLSRAKGQLAKMLKSEVSHG